MSSWAEQYERMKRERLAQEAANKNKNVGFTGSAKGSSSGTSSHLQVKKEPVNPSESSSPPGKSSFSSSATAKPETGSSDALKGTPEPAAISCSFGAEVKTEQVREIRPGAKRPLFGGGNNNSDGPTAAKQPLIGGGNNKSDGPAKRPSQTRDPNDPWFAAYEAKRQEALNNMKQGNLQSVAGASAFCGKIDGVLQYSAQNQVTRLMKKLKKDEKAPKVLFVDTSSTETKSSLPLQQSSSTSAGDRSIASVKTTSPPPPPAAKTASSTTVNSSSRPVASRFPVSKPVLPAANRSGASQSGRAGFTRPPFPAGNQFKTGPQNGNGLNGTVAKGGEVIRHSMNGSSGASKMFAQNTDWRNGGGAHSKATATAGAATGSVFRSKPPPPPSVFAAAYHQNVASSHQLPQHQQQQSSSHTSFAGSAANSLTAPVPNVGPRFGNGTLQPRGEGRPPAGPFYPGQQTVNGGVRHAGPPDFHPAARPPIPPPPSSPVIARPNSSTAAQFSSPNERPGRPSVPTPGRYGTQYGGAPSPGPRPPQAFKPPGYVPPTPPSNVAEKKSFSQALRDAKADSKKSADSWQSEYEARKLSRLQQKL